LPRRDAVTIRPARTRRRFAENPGEVLEPVKEQMEERHSHTDELEERLASLTKRPATAKARRTGTLNSTPSDT